MTTRQIPEPEKPQQRRKTRCVLTVADLETIANALNIAADECDAAAIAPHVMHESERAAFEQSAAQYRALLEALESADTITVDL